MDDEDSIEIAPKNDHLQHLNKLDETLKKNIVKINSPKK